MTEDVEEIKERLEQLERYVNLLETRVDVQERLMKLYTAGRESTPPGSDDDVQSRARHAGDAQLIKDDLRLKGFDYLLRSILTQQGMHNTDLRKAVRGQERLQSRNDKAIGTLNSIEQILREVHRQVDTLVERHEAR